MSPRMGALVMVLGLAGQVLAAPARVSTPPADSDAAGQSTKSAQGIVRLTRWTIDAGGTTLASGGGFKLGATVGQPAAALVGAANLTLDAGFWAPRASAPSGALIFADGFEGP